MSPWVMPPGDVARAAAFGAEVAQLRAACGLSTRQLVCGMGLEHSYLTLIERGKRNPPRRRIMDALFDALDLTDEERRRLLVLAGQPRRRWRDAAAREEAV